MAPFTHFNDKIAVVTGAASGIGRELVLQLAEAGAHVAACDVDQAGLARATRRAAAANPNVRVTAHACDISEEADVVAFAREVADAHACDAIHLLFNNAGVVGGGSFVAGSREEWDRTFAVNWFGPYHCTRAFMPLLLAAEQGVVVNVASINAAFASVGHGTAHTAYSTAKFALRGFTESLIGDFRNNAPHLSVVLAMPGHVRTSMPAPPRSWRRTVASTGTDYRPVTAAQAASEIIQAVHDGEWRVLIGDDAKAIDALVRLNPVAAYEQP